LRVLEDAHSFSSSFCLPEQNLAIDSSTLNAFYNRVLKAWGDNPEALKKPLLGMLELTRYQREQQPQCVESYNLQARAVLMLMQFQLLDGMDWYDALVSIVKEFNQLIRVVRNSMHLPEKFMEKKLNEMLDRATFLGLV